MSDQRSTADPARERRRDRRAPEARGATRPAGSGRRGNPATRQRLVDAARNLLDRSDAALRVSDVTDAAGVSHGTFYVYFAGVDELLELLGHEVAATLDAALVAALDGHRGAAALAPLVRGYLTGLRDAAHVVRSLDRAAPRAVGRRAVGGLLQDRLEARVAAAIDADPEVDVADVDLVASAVAGMVHRFAESWCDAADDEGVEPDVDHVAGVLGLLVDGGVRATAAAGTRPRRGGIDDWLDRVPSPSRPALRTGDRVITHGELAERVDAARGWLHDAGLGEGDRLALLLHNGVAAVELTLAAWKQGVAVVPLDVNWHGDELARVVASSRARAVACDDETRALVDAALAEGGATPAPAGPVVVLEVGAPGGEDAYEREVARRRGQEPPEPAGSGAGAVWYTSGTTEDPKGVVRDEPVAERRRHARLMSSLFSIDESSAFLMAGPYYYSANFVLGLAVLGAGGTVVVMERFDARTALALVERHRVTTALFAPSMLYRILELPVDERDAVDLDSLVAVVHTGAPCPVELKERALEYFGLRVFEWYATTEQGGTAIGPQDWVAHPGSVGRPWSADTQVRIVDEDHQPLAPGEIGLVALRDHRRPPFAYQRGGQEEPPELTADGFFVTGDMGWLDADGYLYLADRRQDRIITDGSVLFPSEVEAVLNAHPSVRDSAVVGVDDAELGERVVAHVVPAGATVDVRKLEAAVRSRLAPYKCPLEWHVVDALPRNASGKLRRRDLRTTPPPA
ncbi:MAG: AMP-binding protein [Acidimicrobiia bacterium]